MLIENPPAHPHQWASFSLSGTWMWPQFLPFSGPPSPSTRLCAQTHPNVTERCSWGKQAAKAEISDLQLYCGETFSSLSARRDHHKTHPGEAVDRCNACGKQLSCQAAPIRHKRIHAEERPYNIKCQSTFICSNSYKWHIWRISLRDHSSVSGRGFTYLCALLAHQRMMLIHSEERP